MRTFFSRIRTGLVRLGDVDPIQHLGDPGETPVDPAVDGMVREVIAEHLHEPGPDRAPRTSSAPSAEVAGRGEPAPVAAEDQAAIVERLDVEPELRPWDTAQAPPRDPAPRPGVRLAKTPHCDGRHGTRPDGEAGPCEWCDALTSQISALKALERRIADLEERVSDLAEQIGQTGGSA